MLGNHRGTGSRFEHPQRLVESLDLCVDDLQFLRQISEACQFSFNALFAEGQLGVCLFKEIECRVCFHRRRR
jgi:hypothetical protein